MKNLFTKDLITKDSIYRLMGFILLVAGQFMHKDEFFSGYGFTIESNLVQVSGVTLLLFPFIFKVIEIYKGNNNG